jgi:hypothetical protein
MAPRPQGLAFIFAMVLAMAVFLAITTWAAAPKQAGGSAASVPSKAANYRPDPWKVY